jgi:hypothetical protein
VNSSLAMLSQLEVESHVIAQSASTPRVNAATACQELEKLLKKFREKQLLVKLDRPRLDPQTVWLKFEASGYDWSAINKLEIRTLFCAEDTAMKRAFIASVERSPDLLRRTRLLFGLVHNYFLVWREMEAPHRVEQLLQRAFAEVSPNNAVVRRWAANKFLFSDKAVERLGEEICSAQLGVDETLRTYGVGPSTRLAMELRAVVALRAARIFEVNENAKDDEWGLRHFRWSTEMAFTDLTLPDAFSKAMATFIQSHTARRSEAFRKVVLDYVLRQKKLGDPRLREYALNWRLMPAEAAQVVLSWLAKESITFFFNSILPDNSENRRRKDFWLKYHRGIKDFQVAVSEVDRWKIESSRDGQERIAYSRIEDAATSAFLMEFEGYGKKYIVVEFSETGNAAYIFERTAFEKRGVSLRSLKFQLKNHLKFDKTHRITHVAQWEPRAAEQLVREFGIRP